MQEAFTIFATVGNDVHPFPRFLNWVRSALAAFPGSRCVLQYGLNDVSDDPSIEATAFVGHDRFEELMHTADRVICHGGTGTLFPAIRCGKRPLVIPRLARFGEHVNDHQLDIMSALADAGLVLPVLSAPGLADALRQFPSTSQQIAALPSNEMMLLMVENFLRTAMPGQFGR